MAYMPLTVYPLGCGLLAVSWYLSC